MSALASADGRNDVTSNSSCPESVPHSVAAIDSIVRWHIFEIGFRQRSSNSRFKAADTEHPAVQVNFACAQITSWTM